MKSGLGFTFTYDGIEDYFLQFFTPRQDYVFALRFKNKFKFSWKEIEYTLYAKSFIDNYTKDLNKVQHTCKDLNDLDNLINTSDPYLKKRFDENLEANHHRFTKKNFSQADDLITKINFYKQGLGELSYYIMQDENITKYIPGMSDDVKLSTIGYGVEYTVIGGIYNSLRNIAFVLFGNMFAICYSGLTLRTNALMGLETLWKMNMGKLVQDFEPFYQKYKMNQEKINQLMDIEFFM